MIVPMSRGSMDKHKYEQAVHVPFLCWPMCSSSSLWLSCVSVSVFVSQLPSSNRTRRVVFLFFPPWILRDEHFTDLDGVSKGKGMRKRAKAIRHMVLAHRGMYASMLASYLFFPLFFSSFLVFLSTHPFALCTYIPPPPHTHTK